MAELFAVSSKAIWRVAAPGDDLHALFDALPSGVYSGLRSYPGGRLLRLDDHLARTEQSMRGLGWRRRLDREALRRALRGLLEERPGEQRIRFQPIEEPIAIAGGASDLFIAVAPFRPVPAEVLAAGAQLAVARGLRRRRPSIKTTDFVIERRSHELPGAYESVMLDEEERLTECLSSNIYGVRDGCIVTAPDGVLEGITRRIVLELAAAMGIAVELERLRLTDIDALDEAFLTSSTREVVPVTGIGERRVGDGRPGPLVARLAEAYREHADGCACRP